MPAATCKTEIIAITEKEWAKLSALLKEVGPELACHKLEDDTSIKDVVAHRAHWIDLFLGWYEDGQAGRKVFFPAKGYKWNQLKAYNSDLRQRQSGLAWEDATNLLEQGHEKLLAFYTNHSNADLYGGPMKGSNNRWTPGRWSESAGASHYRSAAKWIRSCLRNAAA